MISNQRLMINEKYTAQGFVEALIAIVVAGLATLVLMSVAIRTLNSVVKNELADQLTQEAVKGGELISYAVEEYNFGNASAAPFLPIRATAAGNLGACYAIDGDIGNIKISSEPVIGCRYQSGGIIVGEGLQQTGVGINPSECISEEVLVDEAAFVIDQEKGDVFRVMCIHPDSTENVLIAKILTGNMSCDTLNELVTETVGLQDECNIYEYTGVYFVESL